MFSVLEFKQYIRMYVGHFNFYFFNHFISQNVIYCDIKYIQYN